MRIAGFSLVICIHLRSGGTLLHVILTLRPRWGKTLSHWNLTGTCGRGAARKQTMHTFYRLLPKLSSTEFLLAEGSQMVLSDVKGPCSLPCTQNEENYKYK